MRLCVRSCLLLYAFLNVVCSCVCVCVDGLVQKDEDDVEAQAAATGLLASVDDEDEIL